MICFVPSNNNGAQHELDTPDFLGKGHVIMTIEMTIQLVTADDESNKTKDKKRMVEM